MLLTDDQVRHITELQRPSAQARKLRELGYIVLGFSARGRVRALAEHPAAAKIKPKDPVRLQL